MTSTEQIICAHRVDKELKPSDIKPGATLRVYADLLPASDGTAPFCDPHLQPDHRRQHDRPAPGRDRQRPLRLHRRRRRRQADRHRPRVRARPRHREAVLRDARRRHLPLLLPRAGAGHAGAVHPRRRLAQPRLRRLRRGRHRRRFDDARVRLVDRLHLLHAGEAAPRHVPRQAPALGRRQGHRPRTAAAVGREAVAGDVGRARRRRQAAADRLSQHDREHDGGGRGAQRDLRARRDHLRRGIAKKGITELPYPPFAPGADAVFEIDEALRSWRRPADDREAVQPRQRLSRPRKSRASGSRSTRR